MPEGLADLLYDLLSRGWLSAFVWWCVFGAIVITVYHTAKRFFAKKKDDVT